MEKRTIVIELTADNDVEIDRMIGAGLKPMVGFVGGILARTSDDRDNLNDDPCWDLEVKSYGK